MYTLNIYFSTKINFFSFVFLVWWKESTVQMFEASLKKKDQYQSHCSAWNVSFHKKLVYSVFLVRNSSLGWNQHLFYCRLSMNDKRYKTYFPWWKKRVYSLRCALCVYGHRTLFMDLERCCVKMFWNCGQYVNIWKYSYSELQWTEEMYIHFINRYKMTIIYGY